LVAVTGLIAPFIPFLAEAMYQNLVRGFDPNAAASIHLTRIPAANADQIDEALSRDMAAVQEIVSVGRSARTEAGVKVRQPLPAILVHARDQATMDAAVRLKDQILDELNVKDVRPIDDLSEVVTYEVRPKLSLLGPKYGKRLGLVRAALTETDAVSVAAQVERNQGVSLTLGDGSTVQLEPAEILVDLRKRAGFAAAQGPTTTVILDTSLTPALIQEGLARDFVRGVQDARKNAGYRIEETIAIVYEADPEVVAALSGHEQSIRTETLAVWIEHTASVGASDAVEPEAIEGPGGAQTAHGIFLDQITVGPHQVRIGLRREAAAPA